MLIRLLMALTVTGHLFAGVALAAPATEAVGTVKTVRGEATVARSGEIFPAVPGLPLQQGDLLRTADNAALGIILRDDTVISMGPGSTLTLEEYRFEPQTERFSMILRMLKGTFVYLTGVIGRLAPESIRVETPDATIAVRGTRLLIKVN